MPIEISPSAVWSPTLGRIPRNVLLFPLLAVVALGACSTTNREAYSYPALRVVGSDNSEIYAFMVHLGREGVRCSALRQETHRATGAIDSVCIAVLLKDIPKVQYLSREFPWRKGVIVIYS